MRAHTLAITLVFPALAMAHDFVGPESCQSCHPDAYLAWRQSAHARAKASLSPVQRKEARCLTCHSPNETVERQSDIGCETCHGGGQFYSARYVMKDAELARLLGLVDPTEKQCKTCHDASSPSLKSFEFEKKLKLIEHWAPKKKKDVRTP